ncbi:capsule assembly Wzi family protein [Psychrosphaera aestuarii]|uniref:capsule assembly Wzi family protein n=1 Tax=Psychrosphaera aestuarii TaxID=1266052 RepID=UPI001B343890|nr:capsule assembly Wzi family protein [Psychrosphaera aestuarii]
MTRNLLRAASAFIAFSSFATTAASVSGYTPLNQDPLLESHIDRIMIAAERGTVKKPLAINSLKPAYHKVCNVQQRRAPAVLRACLEVKKYLKKVDSGRYINHASIDLKLRKSSDLYEMQPAMTLANRRGESFDSSWSVQGQMVLNFGEYLAFSGGVKGWQGETNLEDTYISIGVPQAQLDIGYKPHWLSPFKQSAMLLSTHAPSFANISLANNVPLTSWNINYELFAGQLSNSDKIRFEGQYTSGKPLITGMHLSIAPFDGFTLAVNRVLQSGGDQRGTPSISEIIDAFLDPSGADNTSDDLSIDEQFGNQAASIVSRFDFNAAVPFSIYLEYAGEDTSRGTNYRLGNTSLSAGLVIPFVFNSLSLNYEYSQWQNAWYGHHVYVDGLQNEGSLIGHFAAEQRRRLSSIAGESVGATHHNLTLGWQVSPSNRFEFNYNQTKNEPLASYDYVTGRQFEVNWFGVIDDWDTRIILFTGKNTLAEKHSGLTLSVAW